MKPYIVLFIPVVMPEPTTIWEQNGWLLSYVVEDLHRFEGLRITTLSYPDGSQVVQVLIDPELPGGKALMHFAVEVKAQMDCEKAAIKDGKDFEPTWLDWTWPARAAAKLYMERKRAAAMNDMRKTDSQREKSNREGTKK